MATIAGVTVQFGLPDTDNRQQNVSVGQAHDASWQFYKYGLSDRRFVVYLRGVTTSTKDSLLTALEADANYQVTIAPDAPVDLGAGSGSSVTAQWVPPFYEAQKINHDNWTITLYFVRVP